ncbi:MAG: hypothetical protein ABUT20_36940 [Bacteroidota bacterium]
MKKNQLLTVGLFLIASVVITSCGPGRGYYSQPRYRNSFSLIISPSPGFIMNRHPDGRYYYRSPEGMLYWRGYDNRFYLDRSYIGRVHYNRGEYNEWKYKGRRYSRRYR